MTKTKKIVNLLSCLAILVTCTKVSAQKTDNLMQVISPKGNIIVSLMVKSSNKNNVGQVFYKINYINGKNLTEIMPFSALGITRKDQKFVDNLSFTKINATAKITDSYQLIHGKKSKCFNQGNEKTFRFTNSDGKLVDIIFRAYDNGVAFRYSFPDQAEGKFFVEDEATTFTIPDGTKRWMQAFTSSYEDLYPLNTNGKGPAENKQEWGFPALYQAKNQPYFVLISESDVARANCLTRLSNKENLNHYKITMPEKEINFSLPWKSQWRVMAIGKLNDVFESTLITDVSTPNKVKDTDWIKPGIVSWIYWANNHGSKDYKKIVEYVDLAVAMKWPYVLIDWEWDQMANGGKIEDAVAYANKKGIKPLMWYNSGDSLSTGGGLGPYGRLITPEARAKEFTWLNKIGVYGIKVDFFEGDQQKVVNYYIDLMEDAAKYKLMINFHGATIPRGWDRTYPNLMSVEGVYGAEWYNNKPFLTNVASKHNATLPFTRNVIGPMDYTPVTFSNSQHPHITSYGHELALSVVFESGFQHFADRPEAYYALPEQPKAFLQSVPTAWDDSKLIDGYPEEKVVVARKKGDKWYIGGINGKDEAVDLLVNFNFLAVDKKYELSIIKDGNNDKSFEVEKRVVKKGDQIKLKCLPRGGFVGILKKQG